jgi:hypothetical protein
MYMCFRNISVQTFITDVVWATVSVLVEAPMSPGHTDQNGAQVISAACGCGS